MQRTFHRRISMASLLTVVILALLALALFWRSSTYGALLGMVVIVVDVVVIERLLHTTYTFTDSDVLVICYGRFARERTVQVVEIIRTQRIRRQMLFIDYVLIEYGADHYVSVQPDNADAFISEINRRQANIS